MKVVLSIVGLILGLILIGNLMPDAITSVVTEDYSENFASTTGEGVTSTSETLGYASYYDDTTGMSVTSDNGDDSPAILGYESENYVVTIGGLHAADTRILTVTYDREANQQFPGLSSFIRLLPFLLIIGLVITCLWGLYSSFRKRNEY